MATSLLDDAPAGTKKPAPILLRAAHDYSITQQALEFRAVDLKKLSVNVAKDGYRREARAIQADADAIEQAILPVFREQRELPLVTQDALEKEIAAALRVFVTQAFSGLGDPKVQITPSSIDARRSDLLRNLTQRVTMFATDLADEAFNQGVAARAQSAEALAMRTIGSLRATGE
jgi:hypothetical protein